MSLLDLLSAVASPQLTSSERTHLRSLISAERVRAERPWASGLVEDRPKTREQHLEERVEDLELALKVLADILAERGLLERGSLPSRVAQMKRDVQEEEESRAEQAEQRKQERRRQAQEAPVTCAGCGAVVPTRDTFASSKGLLCPACHHARE